MIPRNNRTTVVVELEHLALTYGKKAIAGLEQLALDYGTAEVQRYKKNHYTEIAYKNIKHQNRRELQ